MGGAGGVGAAGLCGGGRGRHAPLTDPPGARKPPGGACDGSPEHLEAASLIAALMSLPPGAGLLAVCVLAAGGNLGARLHLLRRPPAWQVSRREQLQCIPNRHCSSPLLASPLHHQPFATHQPARPATQDAQKGVIPGVLLLTIAYIVTLVNCAEPNY